MDIFKSIKQSVSIKRVMTAYGVKFRNNSAICCFHKEKTPSMTISESKQIFRCHGCGVGGDSIFFVSKVFGISHLEAAKKINKELLLNISFEPHNNSRFYKEKQLEEAKERIKKRTEHKEDIEFRNLWMKHKSLRTYSPTEEFWDNLDKLLKTEECRYNGGL